MDPLRAFELRLTMPDGATKHIPVTTTYHDASALAQRYLEQGQAVRVEVWGWRYGRWELDGVIGQPTRSTAEADPDALLAPEDDVLDVEDA